MFDFCSSKVAPAPQTWCHWLVGCGWPCIRKKNGCHRTLSKKVISNSGFSLIDFCQKNCNSMGMAHPLADHVFFISTNQVQPRCQPCAEPKGGFRGWPPFLVILNLLQAVAKSKCGKLLFSIIATTWQDVVGCSQPKPHVTAPQLSNPMQKRFFVKIQLYIVNPSPAWHRGGALMG